MGDFFPSHISINNRSKWPIFELGLLFCKVHLWCEDGNHGCFCFQVILWKCTDIRSVVAEKGISRVTQSCNSARYSGELITYPSISLCNWYIYIPFEIKFINTEKSAHTPLCPWLETSPIVPRCQPDQSSHALTYACNNMQGENRLVNNADPPVSNHGNIPTQNGDWF